jgi:hypothetical protein
MPYSKSNGGFEHASPLGHVPTIQHALVQEMLGRYRKPASRAEDADAIKQRLVNPRSLDQDATDVKWAVAADSSPFEAEVDPTFPSTRILFMQLAAVIVDLTKFRQRSGPFIDPSAQKDAQRASVLAGALPSSNLVRVDNTPPTRAFREEVDALLRRSEVEGRSLASVLLEVEAEREPRPVAAGYLSIATCPNSDCGGGVSSTPIGISGATCPHCGEPLMVGDALRAHETFTEHGSNQEACSRVLSIAERLTSLALLMHLRERRPSALGEMAFITDGPLALFGEVAPIKRPLLRKLQMVAAAQRDRGFGVPIILGLEKSGFFAEHGQAIAEHIPDGTLMRLDDEYVERYITFRGSPNGKDTYYGRHFFYRALTGQLYTLTVPPLGRVGIQAHETTDLADYPTLRSTCELLDGIGTRMYENATIPVTLAHQYAAYPLSAAGRVLKLHAEEHLDNRTELPEEVGAAT